MHKIMISYPLFGKGMEILKTKTDLFMTNSGEIEPFISNLAQAEAFITRNVHPTKEQLDACPNLKIIGIPGVGYQSYDIDYLTKNGIALLYCPGTNGRSVAEHAVTMVLSLAKEITRDNTQVKVNNYGIRNKFDHIELLNKNVGIAGFGAIGKETAKLFNALGMNIYAYDPFVKKEVCDSLGYNYCESIDELLVNSDIISLHMPSLDSTYHMFSTKQFEMMRDGVIIVNCARGSVIDEEALYQALTIGKVRAAGLDVMEKEPFDVNSKLLQLENVLVTPHVGGVTKEASNRTHQMIVETTLDLLNGKEVTNIVNPEALKHAKWK